MAPKVTVLMSVYNSAAYLAEALDSIVNQTYQNFEILIYDDGSTDGSADILAGYDDPRLTVISDGLNKGLATRLNTGIERASGQYIARMDADDIMMPERIAKQVAFMEKRPDVIASGTGFITLPKRKRVVMPMDHRAIVSRQIFTPGLAHPTVMMRTSVLKAQQLRYPLVPCAQDYGFWLLLADHGTLANLPEPLLYYRVHSASVSVSKRLQRIDVLRGFYQKHLKSVLGRDATPAEIDYHVVLAMPTRGMLKVPILQCMCWIYTLYVNTRSKSVLKQSICALLRHILQK